jgi:hypothetical protein
MAGLIIIKWFHGLVVRTLDSESSNPSSSLGGTCVIFLRLNFPTANFSSLKSETLESEP